MGNFINTTTEENIWHYVRNNCVYINSIFACFIFNRSGRRMHYFWRSNGQKEECAIFDEVMDILSSSFNLKVS